MRHKAMERAKYTLPLLLYFQMVAFQMRTGKPSRSSFLFGLWILSTASSIASARERSLVVGECSKLQLWPSLQVVSSPGIKPGTLVLCERVRVHGFSSLQNMEKFAHSLKLNFSHSNSGLRRPHVEVCFHRNASIGIGMCPQGKWQKVDKGLWTQAMSPFDHKLLDIRVAGSASENLELSIEEEFFLYRVIFLILGIFLLSTASSLSKSLAFYYSSAITIGIIFVILFVLFQGMKLLPTGRKNSLAIFMYSSLVGLGSFLLHYLPRPLHSVLLEMGISEDMYYPLTIFLLAFVVLAGAWMGFWAVHKLVLTEEGSVDISISQFVAWSIRIMAVVMILQSSLDPLLAVEALIFGIIMSSLLRKTFRLRFLGRLYKKLIKLVKNITASDVPDLSPFGSSQDKNVFKNPGNSKFFSPRPKQFTLASCSPPVQGLSKTPPHSLSESDVFPSTFHSTPERRKISKDAWEKFTKESTQKAVQELVSSPDFSKWVAVNAERLTVTPNPTTTTSVPRRRKWLLWF